MRGSPDTSGPKIEKIGGFDKYEVENWVDKVIATQELLRDPAKVKAMKVVLDKRAAATQNAAQQLDVKVSKKLGDVFGG